jgi:hypothetical protein
MIKSDDEILTLGEKVAALIPTFMAGNSENMKGTDYDPIESALSSLLSGTLIDTKWFKYIPRIVPLLTERNDLIDFFSIPRSKIEIRAFIDTTFSNKLLYGPYFLE